MALVMAKKTVMVPTRVILGNRCGSTNTENGGAPAWMSVDVKAATPPQKTPGGTVGGVGRGRPNQALSTKATPISPTRRRIAASGTKAAKAQAAPSPNR